MFGKEVRRDTETGFLEIDFFELLDGSFHIPQVDFSTMTQEQVNMAMATDPAMEVVRTAEAATSITRDTG